jgi:hypothetical protein
MEHVLLPRHTRVWWWCLVSVDFLFVTSQPSRPFAVITHSVLCFHHHNVLFTCFGRPPHPLLLGCHSYGNHSITCLLLPRIMCLFIALLPLNLSLGFIQLFLSLACFRICISIVFLSFRMQRFPAFFVSQLTSRPLIFSVIRTRASHFSYPLFCPPRPCFERPWRPLWSFLIRLSPTFLLTFVAVQGRLFIPFFVSKSSTSRNTHFQVRSFSRFLKLETAFSRRL